ncbi:MAG: hypothetical protein M3M94_04630, partial [Actinomycetota bacterium]|nr:hypothetical protein [Actinomycetota bacterium]
MRPLAAALVLVVLGAGCGSGERDENRPAASKPGTLKALWDQPGDNVTVVWGTSDYSPGHVRASFLVVDHEGRPVERPRARVWVAKGLRGKPFQRASARLEDVGTGGGGERESHQSDASHGHSHETTRIYVTRLALHRPGTYWLLAEPVGGRPIQGIGTLVVKARSASPAVGSRAYPSKTPTLASARGDLRKLTTRTPPDTELLRHSIAQSLADRKPFVVVFATPKFCESRTCGPVVDVVDVVRRRFEDSGIRFIHVEIYRDNKPSLGPNRWVKQEWHLPTEP